MTLFIDTANIDEIKRYWKWNVLSGITTNQKIFSIEKGINYKQRILDLLQFEVPVSIELTGQNCSVDALVDEAKEYIREFGDKLLVIKIPMWKNGQGLEVAKTLIDNKIKVNLTCLINMNQVILTCEAGATYASLFYRRMVDCSTEMRALEVIKKCRELIDRQGCNTKIICGSIRKPEDVSNCLSAGAHVVTVTPKVLEQLPYHPKTEETIEEFNKCWREWECKK